MINCNFPYGFSFDARESGYPVLSTVSWGSLPSGFARNAGNALLATESWDANSGQSRIPFDTGETREARRACKANGGND
jgi:hypothetical protein